MADLAIRHRLPAATSPRSFADVGGLMAYGADSPAVLRQSASFVDRILRGAKPADMAVEQPTRFELVINAKTARTLGLTLSRSFLARVDVVIDPLR